MDLISNIKRQLPTTVEIPDAVLENIDSPNIGKQEEDVDMTLAKLIGSPIWKSLLGKANQELKGTIIFFSKVRDCYLSYSTRGNRIRISVGIPIPWTLGIDARCQSQSRANKAGCNKKGIQHKNSAQSLWELPGGIWPDLESVHIWQRFWSRIPYMVFLCDIVNVKTPNSQAQNHVLFLVRSLVKVTLVNLCIEPPPDFVIRLRQRMISLWLCPITE